MLPANGAGEAVESGATTIVVGPIHKGIWIGLGSKGLVGLGGLQVLGSSGMKKMDC